MRKIAYDQIPVWARRAIAESGTQGMRQMQNAGGSLTVRNGVATFNGAQVAQPGEVIDETNNVEETIAFADLPRWAKEAIEDNRGCMLQQCTGGSCLQVSGDSVMFDGKRVVE